MESKLTKLMLDSRADYELVVQHINLKNYSKEFSIIQGFIKDYYERDSKAERVNVDLLIDLISASVQNEKHVERFKEFVEEALAIDISAANVKEVVLQAKKQEMGNELAIAIVNGKEHDALLKKYNEIMDFTDLDELLDKGVEVYDASSLDDLIEHETDPASKLQVYPLAINERLDGGMQGSDHLTLIARPEMGKCLAVGTLVLMADGSKRKVEDVKEGEYVAGPTGHRLVTGLSRGKSQMYRVTYPWGDSYEVNDQHILSLKRSKVEPTHNYGDILNVNVRDYVEWPNGRKERYKGWKTGLDFEEKDLPMDPYLLGVWLGDGSTGRAAITTVDPTILDAFVRQYGSATAIEKGITYSFGRSGLYANLKSAGVWEDKHIPQLYLTASKDQRKQLLAGLLDSDGYLDPKLSGYQIVTIKDTLKDGYLYLARSLGYHATAKRVFKRATNSAHEGSWYWNVFIGAEAIGDVPCRLERKWVEKKTVTPKRKGLQFGIRVEAIGEGEYAGFSLDGDHLFLLADFTVTHNTGLILTMANGFARQGAVGIVFNNEERVTRLRLRALSCATGMTATEIRANPQAAKDIAEQMGYHNIIFVSMSPGTPRQIEAFVERYKAKWFIVDQLRHLAVKSDTRTNQLEEAANAMRNIAKRYDAIAITVTQAGDSAQGKAVLDMGDVDSSNTGIPGACDVLLGIGGTEQQIAQGIRTLSLSKNKIGGVHDSFPVRFNPRISKFVSSQGY